MAPSLAGPHVIDVGSGSPQAIAQRSAVALLDCQRLADQGSRWDARFLIRFEGGQRADPGSSGLYREMVRNALLGTGRFLVTEEDEAPGVTVGLRDALGQEHSDVVVRGPDGEVWIQVRGAVVGME